MIPVVFTLAFVVIAFLVYKSLADFSTMRSKPDIVAYVVLWLAFVVLDASMKAMVIFGILLIICMVIWHFIQKDRDEIASDANTWNSGVSNVMNSLLGEEDNIVTGLIKNTVSGKLGMGANESDYVAAGKAANVVYTVAALIYTLVVGLSK